MWGGELSDDGATVERWLNGKIWARGEVAV